MSLTDLALPEPVIRRGITEWQWRTLFNLFPGAKPESALLVWDYCKSRNLDPMNKPCHIVPMRVKSAKGEWEWRDIVMPGIYAYRITAHRTGLYRGHTKPEYGPDREFAGITAPTWCEMTVHRAFDKDKHDGSPYPVKVWFSEVVATKNDGTANERWARAPIQMLTKCAEAAALREAFPEEFGGEQTAEELEGRRLGGEEDEDAASVTAAPFQRKSDATGAPQPAPSPQSIVETGPVAAEPVLEAEVVECGPPSNVGVIVAVKDGTAGAVTVQLDSGFMTGTRNQDLIQALRDSLQQQRRVTLITQASSNSKKFYPKLIEILPDDGPEAA